MVSKLASIFMFITDPTVVMAFNGVADWLLLTAVPAMVLFILFYYYRSQWRKYMAGRTLMWFAISLLLLLGVNTGSIWVGQNYVGRPFVRVASYAFLSYNAWRLFVTLRRVQKESGGDGEVVSAVIEEPLKPVTAPVMRVDPSHIPDHLFNTIDPHKK